MKTDLLYLTYVATFTAVMFLPYVLDRIIVWGLVDTVGYPDNPKPLAPWAERLRKAHANAIENLAVFATLVLVAHAVGVTGSSVENAAILYFWSRVVHAVAYTLKWPWIRTLGFFGGFVAQMMVAVSLLSR
ncbi:MAG TPA: MAPEG family protein [Usitatibacter sp.]|nr:MAPEG family protein [Usitatibacter sp.]